MSCVNELRHELRRQLHHEIHYEIHHHELRHELRHELHHEIRHEITRFAILPRPRRVKRVRTRLIMTHHEPLQVSLLPPMPLDAKNNRSSSEVDLGVISAAAPAPTPTPQTVACAPTTGVNGS